MYMGEISPIDVSTLPKNVTGSTLPKTDSGLDRFLQQIPDLVAAGLSIANAQKLYNLNLQRIKAGLSPLDPSMVSSISPGFNVGLDPSTRQMLMIGGIGLGLILLLSVLRKK